MKTAILLILVTTVFAQNQAVDVKTSISVNTLILYSVDLLDTSSAEYTTQSANIRAIFEADLKTVASDKSMTFESTTVIFIENSGSTDCTVDVLYTVSLPESEDLSAYAIDVNNSVGTAVNTAIASSDGTYMSTTAKPVVSSSAVAAKTTTAVPTTVAAGITTDGTTFTITHFSS